MVLLKSSDDREFRTDKDIIMRSVLVKNMLDDVGEDEETPIPLPNVTGTVLEKVLEYCEHYRNDPLPDDSTESQDTPELRYRAMKSVSEWDKKFIDLDPEMLFQVILAANYLDMEDLLDLGCMTVADMLKGKSPEDIRKLFNIVQDFTSEEEEKIKKEHEWAEEH